MSYLAITLLAFFVNFSLDENPTLGGLFVSGWLEIIFKKDMHREILRCQSFPQP